MTCTMAVAAAQVNNTAPLPKSCIVDNEVETTKKVYYGYIWQVDISSKPLMKGAVLL